jgi:hypothetical protein
MGSTAAASTVGPYTGWREFAVSLALAMAAPPAACCRPDAGPASAQRLSLAGQWKPPCWMLSTCISCRVSTGSLPARGMRPARLSAPPAGVGMYLSIFIQIQIHYLYPCVSFHIHISLFILSIQFLRVYPFITYGLPLQPLVLLYYSVTSDLMLASRRPF